MRHENTPAVVVDLDRLERNIREMADFAAQNRVALRPHVKTHKSPAIAKMQLAAGARGITVATLREAEAMAAAGCDDILMAYTVVGPDKYHRLIELARRVRLAVAVDSSRGARPLSEAFSNAGISLDVMVEVDTGQHRCGVLPGTDAARLATEVAALPGLHLRGIMTHEGHSYLQQDADAIARTARDAGEEMRKTAEEIRTHGISVPVISMGSTPTARLVGLEPGVTEIRPGNYVFYDMTQVTLGVVPYERCSLRVRCRVISRPAPDRAVIDAGSKTLSSDRGKYGAVAEGYGLVLKGDAPIPGAVLERLSEEHGVMAIPAGTTLEVGDIVEVIPNHACPVVNLADTMIGVRNGENVERFAVEA